MRPLRLKTAFYSVAILIALLAKGAPASAELLTLGYAFQGEGFKVELQAAELGTEADYQESVQGVTEELKKDLLQNPEAPVELGWITGPETERGPSTAEEAKGRPARFIARVKSSLSALGLSPSREGGISFDPARDLSKKTLGQLHEVYLDHSKITWTIVRVLTNTGVRVATLMYAGLNFYQALTVGTGVLIGCTAVAWNSKHLLHFEENFRLYKAFSERKFPKLRSLLESPAVEKRISKPHYYLNWGLLEVMFGAIILFGENSARSLWGLDLDIPGLLPFLTSAAISTASQGVSDLAVAKYEAISKAAGMEKKLLDANLYKRLAFNSVVSVAGFTMTNTAFMPIKVTGYVMLGALSAAGMIYSKYLDRIALQKADPCQRNLIPKSNEE